MEIVYYQLGIFFSIVIAASMFGRFGLYLAIFLAVALTLTHVIVPWLAVIQCFTVFMAPHVGRWIVRENQAGKTK